MTAISTIARKSASSTATKAIKPFAFKGRNAAIRNTALAGIASLAYVEGKSRADTIAQLRLTLGSKPTVDEVNAAKVEYIVGRTAQRLATPDVPRADMSVADRIAFARDLVTLYAAPAQDGVASRKLRKGQKGRRTVAQHKVVRASEEAWSQLKAELGIGAAQTQGERNAKKRAPAMKGSTKRGKGGAVPTHGELVKAPAPLSAGDACQHIVSQAAMLLAFCNKYAKLMPAEYGASVKRFHGAIMQIDTDRRAAEGGIK